jgi:pimeloyl-ACP methyl ester carboxylesterase
MHHLYTTDQGRMFKPHQFLQRHDSERIAYRVSSGKSPGVIYLNGFMSDMQGTKALAVEEFCQNKGQNFIRFDYFGHGASSGDFKHGTIGRWADDALAVLDELTVGPQILVGSSMGAWLMFLVALKRPEKVKGLIGIATGADFTEDLIMANMPDHLQESLDTNGYFESTLGGPEPFMYTITQKLIEDGKLHLLLRNPIPYEGSVHLLHGMKDKDVPWQNSMRIAELLKTDDVTLSFVKNAGHRFAEPDEMTLLLTSIDLMLKKVNK